MNPMMSLLLFPLLLSQIQLDPATVRGTLEGLDQDGKPVVIRFEPPTPLPPATIIDQKWLDDTPAPWSLNLPGETYRLVVDVVAAGTAFSINADGITLDLNGHTVTYDDAPPIVVPNHSFESSSGWKLSNATIQPGTYVKAEVATGLQSLLLPSLVGAGSARSDILATPLRTGRQYVIGLQASNSGPTRDRSSLSVTFQAGSAKLSGAQWRPMQYVTGRLTASDQPGMVRIDADGLAAWRVDDVEVRPTLNHGIVVSPQKWAAESRYPELTRFGTAKNVTIKNGTIRQGKAAGFQSHAVHAMGTEGLIIASALMAVRGPQSSSVHAQWSSGLLIDKCQCESDSAVITSRDQGQGAVIACGDSATVRNSRIVGGPQIGIKCGGIATISGNLIRTRSRYTNGFAIWCVGSKGVTIEGNRIESVGDDFGSRGILVAAGTGEVLVKNNKVAVRELPRNQEYGGCVAGGAYGIQIEDHTGSISVTDNDVSADTSGGCEAAAFRMNIQSMTKATVTGNRFQSIGDPGIEARAMYLNLGNLPDTLVFQRNHLKSNSRFMVFGKVPALTLDGCTFTAEAGMEKPFIANYWPIIAENAVHVTVTNGTFTNPLTTTLFETERFRRWSAAGAFDPDSELKVVE